MIINFKDYKQQVFSGREQGGNFRDIFELDTCDSTDEEITIIIPREVYSITSGFFLAAFGPSIRRLGASGFKLKYTFICDEIIKKSILDNIERALKTSNVLA